MLSMNSVFGLSLFAAFCFCRGSDVVATGEEDAVSDMLDSTIDPFGILSTVEILLIGLTLAVCAKFAPPKSKPAKEVSVPKEERADSDSDHQPYTTVGGRRYTPTTSALVALVRSGRVDELPAVLLSSCKKVTAMFSEVGDSEERCCELLHAAMLGCVTHRHFTDAILAFEAVQDFITVGNAQVWSILLFIAAEAKRGDLGIHYFNRLQEFTAVSLNDYKNVVRCHIQSSDVASFKRFLNDLKTCDIEIDSATRDAVISACVSCDRFDFADCFLANGHFTEAVEVFSFTQHMKTNLARGDPRRCYKLRDLMKAHGVEQNALVYSLLLEAAAKCKDVDGVRDALKNLNRPDRSFRAVNCKTVVTALVDSEMLMEAEVALQLLERGGAAPFAVVYEFVANAYRNAGMHSFAAGSSVCRSPAVAEEQQAGRGSRVRQKERHVLRLSVDESQPR